MKLKTSKKLMLIATVSLLSSTMVVYAATTLFSQTFPAQTFQTPTLAQGSTCSGGALVLDSSASTNPTYSGSPSALVYGCDANGGAAFTAVGPIGGPVSATPTFTTPTGWALAVILVGDMCTTSTPTTGSGQPVILTGGDSYNYCLYDTTASNFASFSITWTQ